MVDVGEPGGSDEATRRLATIVAIDAAGYSHQSEIDEATAVREITAVDERIRAIAASHSGRVFNTAGDGFMLEFQSVTAAVAAAEELQSVHRVPLRVGIHIGEVYARPNGDLLGKGVNVAARLCTLAEPGNILLSGDTKRALPASVVERFVSRGAVRLSKMDERTEAFELRSPWARTRTTPVRWVLAGAAAIAIVAASWFGGQMLLRPQSQSIAVLEFRALDSDLNTFVASLADRVVGAMTGQQLQPVQTSAAGAEDRIASGVSTGAAFVLDGSARADGDDVLVTARLVDARGRLTIWSNEYRRVANEKSYLEEQIAADIAHVLRCAMTTRGSRAGDIDAATLSSFLRACATAGLAAATLEERYQTAQQVTENAPRFSRGWSMLAMAAADMAQSAAPEDAAALKTEAGEALARARRLDANNGESHLAEAHLLPWRDWGARLALIDRALAVEPDLAAAHAERSNLYWNLGRMGEAMTSLRTAIALDPLNPDYWAMQAPLLSALGHQAEADALRERLYRVWPNSTVGWFNRFFNSTYNGDPNEALQMLDAIDSAPVQFERPVIDRWRDYLLARRSGDRNRIRAAALRMRNLVPGAFSRFSIGAVLSSSGEVDAAISMMEPAMAIPNFGTGAFFLTPWTNVRRDRRFMQMVRETGLIQYWRQTDKWPDFCAASDLPYDCATEADRVLPR